MLDDYKYSIGRLVVYQHSDPKLPKQSYGHYGYDRTVGEVLEVEMEPKPVPHWLYTIRNIRNSEITRVPEDKIKFATTASAKLQRKPYQSLAERKVEDGALAEMIAKALTNPDREKLLRSTLKDILYREETAARVAREGADLPVYIGDYIRIRGDLRPEMEEFHNHYAKILSVGPADIAGIENSESKPGNPTLYRTLKKYHVITSEGAEVDIYDAEIKLFYTAHGRKTILNWRAATLLSEAFNDAAPYNLEYEYLADHIFTRKELETKNRAELAQILATLLYVKGKMGWRDYQRRNQYFAGTPRTHLLDSILEISRFDSRRNRLMTIEEITRKQQDAYKLRRLLKQ